MRFDYDESADALYIAVQDDDTSIVARTLEIDRGTLVDVDERGMILGVEVIRPARAWPVEQVLAQFALPSDADRTLRHFFGPEAEIKTFPFARTAGTELTTA